MSVLIIVLLIILLIGGLPRLGWHQYGYGPSGILGIIIVLIVILALMGRL